MYNEETFSSSLLKISLSIKHFWIESFLNDKIKSLTRLI